MNGVFMSKERLVVENVGSSCESACSCVKDKAVIHFQICLFLKRAMTTYFNIFHNIFYLYCEICYTVLFLGHRYVGDMLIFIET